MNSWYKMKLIPHKNASSTAEIDVFDEIGFYGITAQAFKKDFDNIKEAKSITLNISSPGGSVFDGIAIYNLLSEVKDKLSVEVTGLAASISSIIALAGSKVTMRDGSLFMMHNPWTGMFGDAEDLRKEADTLDKIKDQLVGIYEKNSNLDAEAIYDLMDAETWLNPTEAKAFGFITNIDKAEKIAASYNKPVSEYGFKNTPNSEMPISFSEPVVTGNNVEPVVEVVNKEEIEELAEMANNVLKGINKLKINKIKNRINKIKKERKEND